MLLGLVLVIASLRRIPVRGARWCQPPQPASSARRRCTRSAQCQRAAHLHAESARRPFPAGMAGLWVCGSVGGCGLELPPVALFPLYPSLISVYLSLISALSRLYLSMEIWLSPPHFALTHGYLTAISRLSPGYPQQRHPPLLQSFSSGAFDPNRPEEEFRRFLLFALGQEEKRISFSS